VTLPLIDSWEIEPVKGAPYRVNTICANPRHKAMAEHGHHLVRRSQIIGDQWWIRLPDEIVIGNVVGLCAPCHALVTGQGGRGGGHGAAIRWIDNALWWCDVQTGSMTGAISYRPVGPLSFQTPHGDDATILGLDVGPEECPTCGRSKHSPKKGPKKTARKRKTWTVQVPADEEDGAQVLDEIVDGVSAAFDLTEGGALTRYHALTRAGAFVLQNQSAIPKEAKG
jgi:hypothetical protein